MTVLNSVSVNNENLDESHTKLANLTLGLQEVLAIAKAGSISGTTQWFTLFDKKEVLAEIGKLQLQFRYQEFDVEERKPRSPSSLSLRAALSTQYMLNRMIKNARLTTDTDGAEPLIALAGPHPSGIFGSASPASPLQRTRTLRGRGLSAAEDAPSSGDDSEEEQDFEQVDERAEASVVIAVALTVMEATCLSSPELSDMAPFCRIYPVSDIWGTGDVPAKPLRTDRFTASNTHRWQAQQFRLHTCDQGHFRVDVMNECHPRSEVVFSMILSVADLVPGEQEDHWYRLAAPSSPHDSVRMVPKDASVDGSIWVLAPESSVEKPAVSAIRLRTTAVRSGGSAMGLRGITSCLRWKNKAINTAAARKLRRFRSGGDLMGNAPTPAPDPASPTFGMRSIPFGMFAAMKSRDEEPTSGAAAGGVQLETEHIWVGCIPSEYASELSLRELFGAEVGELFVRWKFGVAKSWALLSFPTAAEATAAAGRVRAMDELFETAVGESLVSQQVFRMRAVELLPARSTGAAGALIRTSSNFLENADRVISKRHSGTSESKRRIHSLEYQLRMMDQNMEAAWIPASALQVRERDTAFPCVFAAILPKTDAFACGDAGEPARLRAARRVRGVRVPGRETLTSLPLLAASPSKACAFPTQSEVQEKHAHGIGQEGSKPDALRGMSADKEEALPYSGAEAEAAAEHENAANAAVKPRPRLR